MATLITTPTIDGADGTTTEFFHMQTVEGHVSGAIQLPSGLDGGAAIIGRLHAPIEVVQVIAHARKLGSPPVMPGPQPPDANMVLIGSTRVAIPPKQDPENGLFVFEVQVVHTFARKTPSGPGSAMVVGREPYDMGNIGPVTIPAEAFATGLITTRTSWTLSITGTPVGGTYRLQVGTEITAAIAYNAGPTTIEAALGSLAQFSGPHAGEATCSGAFPTYTINFATAKGVGATSISVAGGSVTLAPN